MSRTMKKVDRNCSTFILPTSSKLRWDFATSVDKKNWQGQNYYQLKNMPKNYPEWNKLLHWSCAYIYICKVSRLLFYTKRSKQRNVTTCLFVYFYSLSQSLEQTKCCFQGTLNKEAAVDAVVCYCHFGSFVYHKWEKLETEVLLPRCHA